MVTGVTADQPMEFRMGDGFESQFKEQFHEAKVQGKTPTDRISMNLDQNFFKLSLNSSQAERTFTLDFVS